MKIEAQEMNGVLVISLNGRLDSTTAMEAQSNLLGRVEAHQTKVVLDLTSLEYVSSAGLRTILTLTKKVQSQSGRLMVASMQSHIKEIFEISGFQAIIPVHPDVAAACKAISQ